jgi:DNA polymerase/3'-5' exonuclease PolX
MNDNIINVLKLYLEQIKAENAIIFKINAIANLIKIIKNYSKEIINGEELKDIKGVGKGSIEKINEIIKTGTLSYLYTNNTNNNNIVNELTEVIGIGTVIAQKLIQKYKIKSLDELIKKVNSGEIKVNDKIMLGLKYVGKFKGKIPRQHIDDIQKYLTKFNSNIVICGSYRRGLEYSSDIDVLLYSQDLLTIDDVKKSNMLNNYVKQLTKYKLIVDNITNNNVTKYMGFIKWENTIRRIDIRLIPYESIYTALVYFTGSYELNKIMRRKAKDLGYKLNEYGLYKNNKIIYITSEKELFKKLDMKYLKPTERNIE